MEALFFGPSLTPLYGVYHPAASSQHRNEGVVLCYPFGQEYMRAHRAFKILARNLSDRGYDVLRFDYRGSGDSHGDIDEYTPLDWLEDINTACNELRDMSGTQKITLVGLRLGALLATLTAQGNPFSRLVLWDPVISGQHYLQEIQQSISTTDEASANFTDDAGTIHFNGFSMPARFAQALLSLQIGEAPNQAEQILQIISHETDDFTNLKKTLEGHAAFHHLHAPAPHNWNYVDHVGGIMLPQPVLTAIDQWMS
jgi:pimeloyl-ACP methyl ester carboxylesterase